MVELEIGIISGSQRTRAQSTKVANYIGSQLVKIYEKSQVVNLPLASMALPLWDETHWKGQEHWAEPWQVMSDHLKKCAGFIIIAPEWSGGVPPILSNFFLLCENYELAHKPGLIVGISASQGGSYPISNLRAFTAKNTKICYVPDHLVIRDVENMLNEPTPVSDEDKYLRERIDYSLRIFGYYVNALTLVRNAPIDLIRFPFGM